MRSSSAVLLGLLTLVAGLLAGHYLWPSGLPAAESNDARLERATTQVEALQEQVRRLEAAEQERAREAARRLAAAPPSALPSGSAAETQPAAAPPPAAAASAAPRTPLYEVAGYEEMVRGVDWSKVGTNLQRMAPLLAEFGQEWAKTGKVPMGLAMKLQEMNAPLVTAAVFAAEKLGLEAIRANTAFTHPVFQANAIASALEAGGQPLTPAQVEALGRLAEQFGAEDARRLQGYDERTWALQKSLEESVLRERFFEAARALLTNEQRALLGPPEVAGRTQMDLFSAGLAWAARMQVLPYASKETLASAMERQVFQHFGLEDQHLPVVKQVVGRWADTLPTDWFQQPSDPLSLVGMVPVTRIHVAVRHELALLEDLVTSVGMDAPGAAKVRATDFVLVPVRSK